MSAVLPSKFDINKLTFEVLKSIPAQSKSGTDKKQIFMKYAGDTLRFQTPIAVTPFAISKPFGDDQGEKEWIIDMDLDKINITGIEGAEHLPENSVLEKRLLEFKNVLKQIDDKCSQHLLKNSKTLWPAEKEEFTIKDIKRIYKSLIKVNTHPEKGEYPDKFRAKFSRPYINKDGKKSFTVFDSHGKEINWYSDDCHTPTEAPFNMKYMLVQAIVQCSGMWIIGGDKVFCSFKVLQIRTWKPSVASGFGFVLEDGETLQEESQESKEESDVPVVEKVVEKVTDDLEDESEYSDEEPQ